MLGSPLENFGPAQLVTFDLFDELEIEDGKIEPPSEQEPGTAEELILTPFALYY